MPAYSTITIDEVTYNENTDPVTLESPYGEGSFIVPDFAREPDLEEPAFVVGIHAADPAIGGEDGSLKQESLIGYKLLSPGTHQDVEVAIFPTPFTKLETGQTFPPAPDSKAEIKGAVWEDFGDATPVVSSQIATINGGLNQSTLPTLVSPVAAFGGNLNACQEAILDIIRNRNVWALSVTQNGQCARVIDWNEDRCGKLGLPGWPEWAPYCVYQICCAL